MRRDAGEHPRAGAVPGVAVMRDAGEDREVAAMGFEMLQVPRRLVIASGLFGKQERRVQPQRPIDQQHPPRLQRFGFAFRPQSDRQHCIEQRQTDGDAGRAEKRATR